MTSTTLSSGLVIDDTITIITGLDDAANNLITRSAAANRLHKCRDEHSSERKLGESVICRLNLSSRTDRDDDDDDVNDVTSFSALDVV